ncbi:MAG: hypothetical protein DRQ78_07950 [Epsilonproteobacteria bacterium]|nr:MAG: hypothetical protein DRQ78_07950 [Campylobacterota bacterium]
MKKSLLHLILLFSLGITTLYSVEENAMPTKIVDPKIASTKKKMDETLIKIEGYAQEGKSERFPSVCAKTDTRILKYTYPDAPQEIVDYYIYAKHLCYGKLHAQALQSKLKQEGKSVCRSMETRLQITHVKSHTNKTGHSTFWNNFINEYNKTCPNNSNTGY